MVANQGPFNVHLLQAAQSEAIQSSGSFDLAEHGFNDRFAQCVDRLDALGAELALHPAPGIHISRCSAPRWPGPVAVQLPAGGDVGIKSPLLADFQVGGAAVAGVGDQDIRQLAGVGDGTLQHGHQIHRVAGLVATSIATIT